MGSSHWHTAFESFLVFMGAHRDGFHGVTTAVIVEVVSKVIWSSPFDRVHET